jgi:hypothetical protein
MRAPTLDTARDMSVPRPVCAICADRTRGLTRELRMTHGVTVWLCATHVSAEYRCSRNGRDFVLTLQRLWEAHGCLNAARRRALTAHLALFADRPPARRPGSYAWPELRRRAEAEFALGATPTETIRRLRQECAGGPVAPPSLRTMQRWFREARWLCRTLPPADRGDDVDPGVGPQRGVEPGSLPVDVDIDVAAQRRTGLAQAVADPGPAIIEAVDGLAHRPRLDLEPAGQVGEHRRQRDRKMEVGHRYPITATSTEAMPGR